MKMRAAIVLLPLLSLPACDSTTEAEESLTLGQAITILRELLDLTEWVDTTKTEACPLGGEATVATSEGSSSFSADTAWASFQWVITPDGCAIQAVGDTLVLEGDPRAVVDMELRYVIGFLEEAQVTITAGGAVTWRRNAGDPEACHMDLAMENVGVDLDSGDVDGSLAGRLCGYEVEIHFSDLGP